MWAGSPLPRSGSAQTCVLLAAGHSDACACLCEARTFGPMGSLADAALALEGSPLRVEAWCGGAGDVAGDCGRWMEPADVSFGSWCPRQCSKQEGVEAQGCPPFLAGAGGLAMRPSLGKRWLHAASPRTGERKKSPPVLRESDKGVGEKRVARGSAKAQT